MGVSASGVYAIQVAMDEEARPFLEAAGEVSDPVRIGRAVHRGLQVGGRTFVLITSGIGMVNAADAAAGAVHRYGEGLAIVSAGTCGGLAVGTAVGEVVVGTETVNVEANAVAFGYVPGQTPGMPASYAADAAIADALAAVEIDGTHVRRGAMGAGDKFATTDIAIGLREAFPALLTIDMETVAVAQTAHNHGIRFAVARAISDLCAPDGTEFDTHVDDAAERSARIVLAALGAL